MFQGNEIQHDVVYVCVCAVFTNYHIVVQLM